MRKLPLWSAVLLALTALAWGQQHAVVTVLDSHGAPVSGIAASAVTIRQGGHTDAVTGWTPLQGPAGRIEMFVAIDDDASSLAPRMQELQKFLASQPPDVATGVLYLRQGTALMAQPLTVRHDLAAHALRVPLGTAGISPSPFESLEAILTAWPQRPNRRRVLIVLSDGVQHVGVDDAQNRIVRTALQQYVAAGVVTYAILVGGNGGVSAGSTDHDGGANGLVSGSLVQSNGFANLGTLADDTGGEAYSQGLGTPSQLQPYLDQISACLRSQYRVDFTPQPGATGITGIKISVTGPHLRVLAPHQMMAQP